MLGKVFIYSASTAINKGCYFGIILLLPYWYSLENIGFYSLALTSSQLLYPFFSLNIPVAILREGVENTSKSYPLTNLSIILSFLTAITILIIATPLASSWLIYSIPLGFLEAIFQALITQNRVLGKDTLVLFMSFLKSCCLLIPLLFFSQEKIETLLNYQIISLTICYTLFIPLRRLTQIEFYPNCKFIKSVLSYTTPMIPHSIAQWISNSSDKYILNHYHSKEIVGYYSYIYTISMGILILNSGIGLTFPQAFISNLNKWKKTRHFRSLLIKYGAATVLLYIIMLSVIVIDIKYFSYMKYQNAEGFCLILYIYLGLYFLGVATIISFYLYAVRSTSKIALNSILSAILNIILNLLMIPEYGPIGAAYSTLISFLIMIILMQVQSSKTIPETKKNTFNIIWTILAYSSIIILLTVGARQLI
jgi:O-antigen/teichoic acid export membrane protein